MPRRMTGPFRVQAPAASPSLEPVGSLDRWFNKNAPAPNDLSGTGAWFLPRCHPSFSGRNRHLGPVVSSAALDPVNARQRRHAT